MPPRAAEEEGFDPSELIRSGSTSFAASPDHAPHVRAATPQAARTRATPWRLRVTLCCGGGGIRTHGSLSTTPVFKTGALDRSATPPSIWRRAETWWIGGRASRRALGPLAAHRSSGGRRHTLGCGPRRIGTQAHGTLPAVDAPWTPSRHVAGQDPTPSVNPLVGAHLESFLASAREEHERGLPRYVEAELRAYLRCGIHA